MAGFVPSRFSSQLGELERAARERRAAESFGAVDALLRVSARLGAVVGAAAARWRAALAARRDGRR